MSLESLFATDVFKWISFALHSIGVAVGAGGAFMSDAILFLSLRNHVVSKSEMKFIHMGGRVTMMGLLVLIISGVGLVLHDPRYLSSPKFLSKMAIVAVVTLNGIYLHRHALPLMEHMQARYLPLTPDFLRASSRLFASGAISMTSWMAALILGSLRGFVAPIWFILSVYSLVVVAAIIISQIVRIHILSPQRQRQGTGMILPEGDYTPLKP